MSKQKMLAARELIQEKRYAEARALLKTIDDPTAKAWLKKLDAIAPEKKKSGGKLVYITAAVVLLSIVIIAATLIARQNSTDEASQNALAQVPTQMELLLETPDLAALAAGEFSTETLTAVAPYVNSTLTFIAPTVNPSLTAINSTIDPCSSSDWWKNDAIPLIKQFFDAAEIAVSTPRASLSPTLLEMRQTQRDFERLLPPECERENFRTLATAMDYAVQGLTDFLSESEVLMEVHLSLANEYFYTTYIQRQTIFAINDELRVAYPHLIWGGDEVNEATATALHITSEAHQTQFISELTATATPTPLGIAYEQRIREFFNNLEGGGSVRAISVSELPNDQLHIQLEIDVSNFLNNLDYADMIWVSIDALVANDISQFNLIMYSDAHQRFYSLQGDTIELGTSIMQTSTADPKDR